MTPAPTPAPVVPSTWNPTTIAVFIGAAVTFLMASLVQAGVVIPAHISSEVQVIVGIIGQVGSVITALLMGIHHNAMKAKVAVAKIEAAAYGK